MSKQSETNKDGSFKRQQNLFSTPFGNDEGELPVEKDRYRLIWTAPCPWSHRASIVRALLGLDDVISIGAVDPIRPDISRIDWAFTLDEGNKDPELGVSYLSELYVNADSNYEGRPTVPAMVDTRTKQVVNNDYFTLTNAFEVAWAPFHKQDAPDLYPVDLRDEIDALNDVIYDEVNNGVYKCGFARSQEAYEEAFNILFARLDALEDRLADKRFLFGDFITDADVRLYVTLVRFDVAYYTAFKANKRRIVDYPNLWGYVRDLYKTPGFKETTDFDAIKRHYHLSVRLSTDDKMGEGILPKGPDLSGWDEQVEREHLSKSAGKFRLSGE